MFHRQELTENHVQRVVDLAGYYCEMLFSCLCPAEKLDTKGKKHLKETDENTSSFLRAAFC